MYDRFNRNIDYLRVSVTDKCNLRCVYCMPPGGVPPIRHEDVLSFEEMAGFVQAATEFGVRKVRITGGEPLVRRNVVTLVQMLRAVPGIEDFGLTTNGTLLARFAAPLAAAGLRRINISLDAVDPQRYAMLTRGGNVGDVLEGIQAARDAGFFPIKLNCVIARSPEEPDAQAVAALGTRLGLDVRYIPRMDLSAGVFSKVIGGTGGDCGRCNRLRLSCDGWIRPCLFSDIKFNVRELGPQEALRRAIDAKPESGQRSGGRFNCIGG